MKKLILKKAFSQTSQTTNQDTSNNQDNFVKETQMSETSQIFKGGHWTDPQVSSDTSPTQM